jgi:hypothetical protein
MNLLCAILLLACGGEPRATAKLALAIGSVEAKAPAAADFVPVQPGAEFETGTALRTGEGVLASVDVEGGMELRIAPKTELVLEAGRVLDLKRGQVWVNVPQGPACTLKAEVSTTVCEPGSYDLEYSPRVPNTDQGAFTMLHVLQGKAVMANRRFKQPVTTGYNCTVVNAVLNTPDPVGDGVVPTRWIHPILVAKGPAGAAEVERRARGLLPRLGRVPKDDPYEAALKSLGEGPMTLMGSYLATPSNPADLPRRITAARVMSEVATAKSAGQLVALLNNEVADVRVLAAGGLARLAGTDQGRGDAYWKGDDRAAGIQAWEAWAKDPVPAKR